MRNDLSFISCLHPPLLSQNLFGVEIVTLICQSQHFQISLKKRKEKEMDLEDLIFYKHLGTSYVH